MRVNLTGVSTTIVKWKVLTSSWQVKTPIDLIGILVVGWSWSAFLFGLHINVAGEVYRDLRERVVNNVMKEYYRCALITFS